jgi:2-polyprenyl-3-methyl-5-hydroxy-6-metoxy-1,4-benzoquinol methylase
MSGLESKLPEAKTLFEKYSGVWGGRTDNGEEMWWSTPNLTLVDPNAAKREKARTRFYRDTRQHFILEFLAKTLKGTNAPKIIDFGCGSGGTTLNFSNYLGLPIEGFDLYGTQLEIAREQNRRMGARCTFRLLDSEGNLPVPDGSLDTVLSLDVLGHVPDPEKTLKDWARALKPGGFVVLFTEASYSSDDRSLMARLARLGKEYDMTLVVPEHISLLPRETIEA